MTSEKRNGHASEEELRRPFVRPLEGLVHGTVPVETNGLTFEEYEAQIAELHTESDLACDPTHSREIDEEMNRLNMSYPEFHERDLANRRERTKKLIHELGVVE